MILLVSDRSEKITQIGNIFTKNADSFTALTDEISVLDTIKITPTNIIIIDTLSEKVHPKNLIKKIKSIIDNPVIILLTNMQMHLLQKQCLLI